MKTIEVILYRNGKPSWILTIADENGIFSVSEKNITKSLFSNPLATGNTIGQALDNFLALEQKLINNL